MKKQIMQPYNVEMSSRRIGMFQSVHFKKKFDKSTSNQFIIFGFDIPRKRNEIFQIFFAEDLLISCS